MVVSAHSDIPGRFKIPYTTSVDVNNRVRPEASRSPKQRTGHRPLSICHSVPPEAHPPSPVPADTEASTPQVAVPALCSLTGGRCRSFTLQRVIDVPPRGHRWAERCPSQVNHLHCDCLGGQGDGDPGDHQNLSINRRHSRTANRNGIGVSFGLFLFLSLSLQELSGWACGNCVRKINLTSNFQRISNRQQSSKLT